MRSEFQHTNGTTDMGEFRGYIDEYLGSLSNIVLKAILKSIHLQDTFITSKLHRYCGY